MVSILPSFSFAAKMERRIGVYFFLTFGGSHELHCLPLSRQH